MENITKDNHTLKYEEVRRIIEERLSVIDKSELADQHIVEENSNHSKQGFFSRGKKNLRSFITKIKRAFRNSPNKE